MPSSVQSGWQRNGLDAKTAFPNADLDEGINVHQPQGFAKFELEYRFYLLRKALYGPKQSSKQ